MMRNLDGPRRRDRKSTRLNSSHTVIYTLSLHDALPILELFLRVADFRELREGVSERSLSYRYDAELGWAPAPNSSSVVAGARIIHAQHNSLGLRDIEF